MGTSGVLANHAISLRLSVVDSIASGNAVYTETQNTTTDAVGLFSVVIGNGTPTLGTFANINWGKNYKWLKTEIDTLGGSSFVVMGITQFMSTPYALYANTTKTELKSMFLPDGLKNPTNILIDINNYTVPLGKNLYLPLFMGNYIINNTDTIGPQSSDSKYLVMPEGTTIKTLKRLQWNVYADSVIAFTIDKTVNWIYKNVVTNPITVPAGKSLIILTTQNSSNNFSTIKPKVSLNGIPYFFFDSLNGVVITSGNTLSGIGSVPIYINGYFIDN